MKIFSNFILIYDTKKDWSILPFIYYFWRIFVKNNYIRYRGLLSLVPWVLLSVLVVILCVSIDSIFYSQPTLVNFNFFYINVYKNLGKHVMLEWGQISKDWNLSTKFIKISKAKHIKKNFNMLWLECVKKMLNFLLFG